MVQVQADLPAVVGGQGGPSLRRGLLALAVLVIAAVLVASYVRDEPDEPAPQGTLEPMPEPTGEERFVQTKNGFKIWPRSVPLVEGAQYRYNTGHCGLQHIADFDGSLWIPHVPEDGNVPDFFINEVEGTLTVLSHERALFRAPDGDSALLTRHDGPLIVQGCQ